MSGIQLKQQLIMNVLSALARLPFCALYCLSDAIAWVLDHLLRYRHKGISDNLQRSFPEMTVAQRRQLQRQYYHHMADVVVETIKLLHITEQDLNEHIEFTNPSFVEQLAEDGRSIVAFLGHYGNWEWMQDICRHYNRPTYTCEIYQPLRDDAMNEVMHCIRSRWDTTLIPSKQAMRHLLRLNNEGTQFLCGFIADQRPKGVQRHWTTFLHQDTAYVTGGEDIGKHIHAHFVYLDVEKTSRGHYRLTFQELQPTDEDFKQPYPYTIAFLRKLEQRITAQPAYWLWSHKRWKYKKK